MIFICCFVDFFYISQETIKEYQINLNGTFMLNHEKQQFLLWIMGHTIKLFLWITECFNNLESSKKNNWDGYYLALYQKQSYFTTRVCLCVRTSERPKIYLLNYFHVHIKLLLEFLQHDLEFYIFSCAGYWHNRPCMR